MHVGRIAIDHARGGNSGTVARTVHVEGRFDAFLQTYRGDQRGLLAAAQVLLVATAAGLTWFGDRWWRRAGLAILAAWALLWLGNALAALAIAPDAPVLWIHLAFVGPPTVCALLWCAGGGFGRR